MRTDGGRESENVEDRRGTSAAGLPLGGRGIGLGTVVLVLVAMYFGVDPSLVLDLSGTAATPSHSRPLPAAGATDPQSRFVSVVLADTEDTWRALFASAGKSYRDPKLVLFTGATQSACGLGQAAMGPFYCPLDQKVYIDLAFYRDLQQRFHAPGDFAQAYVIAHEVGHHVQNLLGISEKVHAMQQRGGERQANALSVRLELQADCLAGVWAHHAQRARNILEAGDVEEALAAATAIGDDRLQKQSQGYVVPESFTHGSSAQRVRWFKRGIDSGLIGQCDTFAASAL